MNGLQNIGINDYFKRYGYKYGIQRGIFTALPFHIVKDYENKKILYYRKTEQILKRKYLKAASKDPEGIQYGNIDDKNPIWVYWKQGLEKAPPIVKSCIQSIKNNTLNKVFIITDQNISEYIIFPEYIYQKFSNGNMSTAAFSDLLRFSLLEHFGGTWIDATVYLSDSLPYYIMDSEFFAYQDTFGLIKNPALISSWLLHCRPHNVVMVEVRNMTFAYWEQENYVIDYLLPYIFLTISFERHQEIYKYMPYANSDYCHLMLNNIGEIYDRAKYEHITHLSNVHKLSYKLHNWVYCDEKNFYHKIVENN